jgi:hypothetical protein
VIVEMREYTLHAGKVPEYLQLYERERLAIQREILGRMLVEQRNRIMKPTAFFEPELHR